MAGCIGGSIQSPAGARVDRTGIPRVDRRPPDTAALRPARYPDVDLAAGRSESGYGKKNNRQQPRHATLLCSYIIQPSPRTLAVQSARSKRTGMSSGGAQQPDLRVRQLAGDESAVASAPPPASGHAPRGSLAAAPPACPSA